jgi:hypothetical protein
MATPVTSAATPSSTTLLYSECTTFAGPAWTYRTKVPITGTMIRIYNDTTDIFSLDYIGGVRLNHLHLALSPVVPTPHTEGTVYWDSSDHTLNMMSDKVGSTLQIGQENWVRVVNKTGVTLTDGQVVYISGAQGNRPTAALAAGNSVNADKTIGVVTTDIANNQQGYVATFGVVNGFNTSGFTDGDELWLHPTVAGTLTTVRPVAPNHAIRVGYALNSTNNGKIMVSVHSGTDLSGLHDVYINAVADNNVLQYVAASSRWENKSSLTLSGSVTCTTLTASSTVACGSAVGGNEYFSIVADNTNFWTTLEAQKVGVEYSRLRLNPNGGAIVIGTDPGGSELLRVGGAARVSGQMVIGAALSMSHDQAIYAGGSATANLRCYFDAGNSYWRAPSGGHVWQSSAGTNRMTLSDAGILSVVTADFPTSAATGNIVVAGGIGLANSSNGVAVYLGGVAAGSASINSGYGLLLRHQQFGYAGYWAAQVGSGGRPLALNIDVGTVAGGAFGGTAADIITQRNPIFLQPNSGATDWEYSTPRFGQVIASSLAVGFAGPPARPLDVYGSAQFKDASGIGTTIWSEAVTGAGGMGTNTNHPFAFLVNGTERGRINTSGAFIIGTDPGGSELLRVGGSFLASGSVTSGNVQIAPVAGYNCISLNGAGNLSTAVGIYSLASDTNLYLNVPTARSVRARVNGNDVGIFDDSATAGHTRFMIYDVDNATLERVTVGAADSGGTGFKVLRIPN